MTLNFIGIGLNDEKDISVKGLELVKKADFVYLESYTSKLNCNIDYLEKLYGKKIIFADRKLVEMDAEKTILQQAKTREVAFLVVGDVFSATTTTKEEKRMKTNAEYFRDKIMNEIYYWKNGIRYVKPEVPLQTVFAKIELLNKEIR